jgi:hypothetical protein
MGKMPRYLKRFCGYGFNGGHYAAIDGCSSDHVQVDFNDPMYKPAAEAKPQRVPWSDVKGGIVRTGDGQLIVSISYENEAIMLEELRKARTRLTDATALAADAQADVDELEESIKALHPDAP